MFIGDTLARRAIYSPDRLAVVDAGKAGRPAYTYAQLNERANRFANWLRDAAGITKGDRIGIVAYDGVEFLDAFFACGKLGAILACYNWRMHWRELVQVIDDTTPQRPDFLRRVQGRRSGWCCPRRSERDHTLHIEGEGLPGSRHFESTLGAAPRRSGHNRVAVRGGHRRADLHRRHDRRAEGRADQPPHDRAGTRSTRSSTTSCPAIRPSTSSRCSTPAACWSTPRR